MNICEQCEGSPEAAIVYDTGVCHMCRSVAECTDRELLRLYRGLGVSDETIWRHLPRLRSLPTVWFTLEDARQKVALLNEDQRRQ